MTNELKYIIVDMNGLEFPVVFSPLCPHNKLLAEGHKIVSAGFCKIWNDGGITIGEHGSISLGIKFDNERLLKDCALLKSHLFSSMD